MYRAAAANDDDDDDDDADADAGVTSELCCCAGSRDGAYSGAAANAGSQGNGGCLL